MLPLGAGQLENLACELGKAISKALSKAKNGAFGAVNHLFQVAVAGVDRFLAATPATGFHNIRCDQFVFT